MTRGDSEVHGSACISCKTELDTVKHVAVPLPGTDDEPAVRGPICEDCLSTTAVLAWETVEQAHPELELPESETTDELEAAVYVEETGDDVRPVPKRRLQERLDLPDAGSET